MKTSKHSPTNIKLSMLCLMLTLSTGSSLVFAHGQHVNTLPWSACAKAKLNDACEYNVDHKDMYKGTCQAMSEVLMCVRNQPIETLLKPSLHTDAEPHIDTEHEQLKHSHDESKEQTPAHK